MNGEQENIQAAAPEEPAAPRAEESPAPSPAPASGRRYPLRPEEVEHYRAAAAEAVKLIHDLVTPSVEGSSYDQVRKAVLHLSDYLVDTLDGYAILNTEYNRIEAEAQSLMNKVRAENDKFGKLGAGKRFTPPEELATPDPGADLGPELPFPGAGEDPEPPKFYRRHMAGRNANPTPATIRHLRLELADRDRELNQQSRRLDQIRRGYQLFVYKVAGVPARDIEEFLS